MNRNILKLIFKFLSLNSSFRRSFFLSIPLIVLASLTPTFFRWYLAKSVVTNYEDNIIYGIGFLLIFTILAFIIRIFSWMSIEIKGSSSTVFLMKKIFAKVSNLKIYNITNRGTSDFIGRLSVDAKSIREDFVISMGDTLNAVVELLVSLVVILSANISLIFWTVPIFFIFFKIQNHYGTSLSSKRNEMSQKFTSVLEKTEEVVNGFSTIKNFDKALSFESSLNNKMDTYLDSATQIAEVTARGETFLAACSEIFGLITYSYVVYGLSKGSISIEWAGVVIGTIYSFLSVLQQFTFSITGLSGSSSSLDRVLSIFDFSEESKIGKITSESDFKEDIIFKDCSLSYAPGADPVLKNVNLKIEGLKHTLLIGKTGSGKSTIINAIFQLIDVGSGTIYLGDREIQSFDLGFFRNQISILPQDPIIINGSVRKNIDRSRKLSDSDYCKTIERFGLGGVGDLLIKKNGEELSPGQKQLISLARIYTDNAPIIILDEPSSKLDDISEKTIWNCVSSSFKNKTVIIISHKVEHLDFVDFIYKIQDGKVEESSFV